MPSNKSQQSGKDAKTNSTRGRNKGSSTTGKIDLTSLTSNMRDKSATRTACFVDGSNVTSTTKPDKVDTSGGAVPLAVALGSGRKKRQQVNQTPNKTPLKNNSSEFKESIDLLTPSADVGAD